MNKIYGQAPADLGLIDLDIKEMMFWLYCPVKSPRSIYCVPDTLKQFEPLLDAVREDVGFDKWAASYIYVTAKRLYVSPESPGNRPGWHSDGFMTEDLNYVWYDDNPTVFWEPSELVSFVQDHALSLAEMESACEPDAANHRVYPLKHLLRLDQSVMHKVADVPKAGVRTFVKISVSPFEYRGAGNSINHGLGLDWDYIDRAEERNCPEVTPSAVTEKVGREAK